MADPATFDKDVLPAEREEIAARRKALQLDPDGDLVGLAISGGGIRSATFNLGAIQTLHANGAFHRFDYLSTVSGGGFIGGCVSSLLNDPAFRPDDNSFPLREVPATPDVPAVRHLRNSGNYLAPGGLLDRIRIPALLVRGVILNLYALMPYLMLAAVATQFAYDSPLRLEHPLVWSLADFTVTIVPLLLFLIVLSTFPIVSTLVGNRLSWAGRNRYEALLATTFLLAVLGLALEYVFDVIDVMADFNLTELRWWIADHFVMDQSFLIKAAVALAIVGAIALAAKFVSKTASKVQATIVLYATGLVGPLVVAGIYLLLCVAYIEPFTLDTVFPLHLSPADAAALDRGQIPLSLLDQPPLPVRSGDYPLPEDLNVQAQRVEQRVSVNGGVARIRMYNEPNVNRSIDLRPEYWFQADSLNLTQNDLETAAGELDAGRLPNVVEPLWFYVNSARFTLAGSAISPVLEGHEWRVTTPKHDVFAIRRGGEHLEIYWALPFRDDPKNAVRESVRTTPIRAGVRYDPATGDINLGHMAHVSPIEKGESWILTTAGRRFEIARAGDRFIASWDLAHDLERGLVTPPVRAAFTEKGGLPEGAVTVDMRSGVEGVWTLQADDRYLAGISKYRNHYRSDKRPPFMASLGSKFFFGFAVFWLLLNLVFFNVNASSVHDFYRDRLSKAYLLKRGPDASAPFVQNDQQKLTSLNQPGTAAPYHLINVSLNLNGLTEPDMRGRLADFFVFAKRFTGSVRTGYCETAALEKIHRHLNLGTAMAISGAAAAPNAGMTTVKPLVFLLTLLNVRLGYWMPHPGRVGSPWWRRWRLMFGVGPRYLWREATGRLTGNGPYVNLSDGGHIENLAIYPLLRRRCKVIVALDAEQDEALHFGGLMQLLMYARVDFGIDIHIDLDAIRPVSGRSTSHFAIGTIHYADGDTGYLVYVKASMTGDEDVLLQDYRAACSDFPHQSTANQFFDERQFEMYRALGAHIVDDVCAELVGTCRLPLAPEVQQTIARVLFGAKAAAPAAAV